MGGIDPIFGVSTVICFSEEKGVDFRIELHRMCRVPAVKQ